jgi:hypothetical protein
MDITVGQVIAACNGKDNYSLVLMEILNEGWNVPENHFFPLWFHEIKAYTNLDHSEYLECFESIKSKFGIDFKASRSDPEFKDMALFAFDRALVIALIDLYANA